MEYDLLHPDPNEEKQKHKLKKLVQKPNSFFLDIKCKRCNELTHTFSCAQSVIKCKKCNEVLANPTGGKIELCKKCNEVLANPTGGKIELKEGVKIRRKGE